VKDLRYVNQILRDHNNLRYRDDLAAISDSIINEKASMQRFG
jgi:hypothetical protein